jgi:crotonobetainyl-CoA:carnitine CoA-transferase CaiB-like acyl-CoA transferase
LIELLAGEHMAGDLAEDRWQEEEYRIAHVDMIVEVLTKWTLSHTVNELFELGQIMRFPWARVNSPDEVYRDPQLGARNFFIDVDHPEYNRSFTYPGEPWRFSGSSIDRPTCAPLVGEHNYPVYHGELGMSEEEIEQLTSAHII